MPTVRRPLALIVATLLAIGSACAADDPAAPARQPLPPPTSPGALGEDQLAHPLAIAGGLVCGDLVQPRRDVRVFKGIPYAAPPVGALRWKAPRPVVPWDGVRACDAFGPACPQPPSSVIGDVGPQSEDCLTLNVWTPAKRSYDRYPVLVWIHGGAYTTGAASLPWYDGQHLARQGCVVVTFNYRLGPFGFLAHPRLDDESDEGVSGNYGLLDQVAALEWVRDNIGAFGGDPGRVTLFGESAGSASICRLMVCPLAQRLFHGAIAESGGVHEDQRHLRSERNGLEPMEKIGMRVARTLGCDRADDPLAALRAVPPQRLLEAAQPSLGLFGAGTRYGPVVDGWAIPYDPALMWNDGRQAKVPLIVGTNADEGRLFLRWFPRLGVAFYDRAVRARFGGWADAVLGLYGAGEDGDVADRLSELITDTSFTMPARALARAMDKAGAPCWLYRFARVAPALAEKGLGATHAAEIPYVFGTLPTDGYDATDRALSQTLRAAWVRFAATGDPNGGDLAPWPGYDRERDRHLEVGDLLSVQVGLKRAACDLFDQMWDERSHLAEGMERVP